MNNLPDYIIEDIVQRLGCSPEHAKTLSRRFGPGLDRVGDTTTLATMGYTGTCKQASHPRTSLVSLNAYKSKRS